MWAYSADEPKQLEDREPARRRVRSPSSDSMGHSIVHGICTAHPSCGNRGGGVANRVVRILVGQG